MAKIEFAFPVDKVHGRLSRQHKIGFAHRTASKLNYSTSYGKRSTPVSDDEKQYRTYWGQVASAVAQRMTSIKLFTKRVTSTSLNLGSGSRIRFLGLAFLILFAKI